MAQASASLNYGSPLDEGWYYTEDEHTTTTQPLPQPL